MEIEVYTLSSGSKSNATYIRCGDTRILIDAGMSMRALDFELKKIDTAVTQLNAIFITHEHSDHIKGLPTIAKKTVIPIHVSELSEPYLACERENVITHSPVFSCPTGDMDVESFITPHDSHGSVGYIVKTYGHTIGVATDLGYVPMHVADKLAQCDSIVLESNHDEKMLEQGSYPYILKKRILSDNGHLSNKACADCIGMIAENGVKNIMLAHLSDENNRPNIAKITTATELARRGFWNINIAVANRSGLTKLC